MDNHGKQFVIREIKKEEYCKLDSFVATCTSKGGAELLQSSIWLQILKADKASRQVFIALSGEEIVASVLVIEKVFAKFFSYLYSPRGPILKKDLSANDHNLIIQNLKDKFFAMGRYVFLRFEPLEGDFLSLDKNSEIPSLSFVKTIDLQPKTTLLIDLQKNDEELLKEMHQKTRYNIRLAMKKNLKLIEANSSNEINDSNENSSFSNDFSDFWRLMKKTSNRDAFGIHSEEHYRNLIVSGKDNIKLYFIEHEGLRIAAGIFSFFGNKATYLHGASDDNYKSLMAPYLLQFELMKIAREKDCKLYDFYGIDEDKWPGVTRFKKGFGGFVFSYAGTYDLIFKKSLYSFYIFLRKLRRLF